MQRAIAGLALVLAWAATAHAATPAADLYGKPQITVTVDGGRKINFVCQGKGSPTVILTAGLGGWSSAWSAVAPPLAKRVRLCAWDRAGYGFSDGSPKPQSVDATTADLEQALKAGHIGGPYVLVGHSAGAYETLRFTDRHRADVVGIVLVDPSVPDQDARFAALSPVMMKGQQDGLKMASAFQRTCGRKLADGSMKPDDGLWKSCFKPAAELPPATAAALAEADRAPGRFETKASLAEQFAPSSVAVTDPKRNYGDLPLIVLTQGKGLTPPGSSPDAQKIEAAWIAWHDEYAALSSRGLNLIVRGSGHMVPLEKPQAVTAAISAVLDMARR